MNLAPRKTLAASIRQNLLLGLVFLAPFILTLWVFFAVVRYLDSAIYAFVPLKYYVPGLGLVIAFVLVFFAGAIAKTFLGKFINHFFDSLMNRVPVLRGLYSSAKQISGVFFNDEAGSKFNRVVLVPFPAPPSRSIGFVSGPFSESESFVFIPTAPNPTSGYVLIFKNSELEDSHMEVDEAFRIIVSCGFLSAKTPEH